MQQRHSNERGSESGAGYGDDQRYSGPRGGEAPGFAAEYGGYHPQAEYTGPAHDGEREQQAHHDAHHHAHHHDADYQAWRLQQLRALDEDYRAWREERYQKFSEEFTQWRQGRQAQGAAAAAPVNAPADTPADTHAPGRGGKRPPGA